MSGVEEAAAAAALAEATAAAAPVAATAATTAAAVAPAAEGLLSAAPIITGGLGGAFSDAGFAAAQGGLDAGYVGAGTATPTLNSMMSATAPYGKAAQTFGAVNGAMGGNKPPAGPQRPAVMPFAGQPPTQISPFGQAQQGETFAQMLFRKQQMAAQSNGLLG
jgi:hypothetical protein